MLLKKIKQTIKNYLLGKTTTEKEQKNQKKVQKNSK